MSSHISAGVSSTPPPVASGSAAVLPLEARSLRKLFGTFVAVDNLDLTVRAGDVYGFLGPNGAGKTTSLRMILGLIRPTEGSVSIFGRDPTRQPVEALRGVAGFVEEPTFYPYMRARTNLELLAGIDHDVPASRVDEVLDTVGLGDRAHDKVGGYSHGMRQRLGIAAALLRRPRLLLLDEPTNGLDPASMRDMRALIRDLAASGMSVLLSSHLMSEVEELCNRVAIVQHGRIRYEGLLSDLLATARKRYRLETTDNARSLSVAQATNGVHDIESDHGGLYFAAEAAAAAALSIALGCAGIGIYGLTLETQPLEELFFELTGTARETAEA